MYRYITAESEVTKNAEYRNDQNTEQHEIRGTSLKVRNSNKNIATMMHMNYFKLCAEIEIVT